MKTIPSHIIRQLFVILLILFLSILIFRELTPYIGGVLGAITFYVLLRKWMSKLLNKGWNKNLASGLLMLASFVGILVPISLIIIMLTSKIGRAVDNSEKVINAIKNQIDIWEINIGYNISNQIDSSKIGIWIGDSLQNLAGSTFDAFISIGIMYFMLYYLLIYNNKLNHVLERFIPFTHNNVQRISAETNTMVTANAIGIPLVAFCQGIIALIGFLIFGVPDPFFWFIITTVGSMIPFIGTAIGILPVTILLYAQGMHWQAIAMFIYGIVVVGATDNVIRLYMLRKLSNVHPLITLIGVIVGVPLFGFIGLIFGPLLISLFLLIIKIYKNEYSQTVS